MLLEPTCFTRKCKFFIGVIQLDETERTETNNCTAFLDHIPREIAYGNNLHSKPLPDQKNNIVFEKEKEK